MQTLNSPIELGLRALALLTASFPRSLNLDRLLLMDYCLLHSADLGGPPSVLPPIPTRGGEFAVKRPVLQHGLQVMIRAGLIELMATSDGLTYRAAEEAAPFLKLVDSPLTTKLNVVAHWVALEFGDLPTEQIRNRTRAVAERWAEQWTDDVPAGRWPAIPSRDGEASP